MITKLCETCCECGFTTGRAGRGEDSLYIDDDGPYCEDCYEEAMKKHREDNGQFGVGA